MSTRSTFLDVGAIALSGLCVIHCLALPLGSALLPVLGTLAEAEWVHRLLVVLAAPIPVIAIVNDQGAEGWRQFAVMAAAGLSLLLAASFVEALHDSETVLTVAGASLLALAHLRRWARRHRGDAPEVPRA